MRIDVSDQGKLASGVKIGEAIRAVIGIRQGKLRHFHMKITDLLSLVGLGGR